MPNAKTKSTNQKLDAILEELAGLRKEVGVLRNEVGVLRKRKRADLDDADSSEADSSVVEAPKLDDRIPKLVAGLPTSVRKSRRRVVRR